PSEQHRQTDVPDGTRGGNRHLLAFATRLSNRWAICAWLRRPNSSGEERPFFGDPRTGAHFGGQAKFPFSDCRRRRRAGLAEKTSATSRFSRSADWRAVSASISQHGPVRFSFAHRYIWQRNS